MADRMCIVTRAVKDEAELIRFVRSPEGVAVPDLARKLPGRGVWVSLARARVAEAAAKKLFSRGFQAETAIPPDLEQRVSMLLRQQALSLLSRAMPWQVSRRSRKCWAGGGQNCCFMERRPRQTVAGSWTNWRSPA